MGFILGPILAALFVTAWEMFGTAFRTALAGPGSAAAEGPETLGSNWRGFDPTLRPSPAHCEQSHDQSPLPHERNETRAYPAHVFRIPG